MSILPLESLSNVIRGTLDDFVRNWSPIASYMKGMIQCLTGHKYNGISIHTSTAQGCYSSAAVFSLFACYDYFCMLNKLDHQCISFCYSEETYKTTDENKCTHYHSKYNNCGKNHQGITCASSVHVPLVCCAVFGYVLSTFGAVKPNPDERALTSNDLLRNT